TLYRFTIKEDGTIQETALADNIRSIKFSYWEDSAATQALKDLNGALAPNIGGGGQYKVSNTAALVAERTVRGKIRAVSVTLVGMNPQKDAKYTHPTDTIAKNYRQFELQSTIVGRNLGVKGIPQTSTKPPDPPVLQNVCKGYCGVAVVTWEPAPGTIDTTFSVAYDTNQNGSYSSVLPAGTQTYYAVDLTQLDMTKTYYFKVIATNTAGSTLSKETLSVDIKNATKPTKPTGVTATMASEASPNPGKVTVTWKAPTSNASGSITCTPSGTPTIQTAQAELQGFRVYRSKDDNFEIDDTGVVQLANEDTGDVSTDGFGNWTFVDTTAVNCEVYYYRVVAVEWCAAKNEYNTSNDTASAISDASDVAKGMAYSEIMALAPENLSFDPTISKCDYDANKCTNVILTWNKVEKDAEGNATTVDNYRIERQQYMGGSKKGSPAIFDITDGSTTFNDPDTLEAFDTASGKNFTYEYSVYARYCDTDGEPARILFPNSCDTGATVKSIGDIGGDGSPGSPYEEPDSFVVVSGTDPVTAVSVSIDGDTA
ncbi:MAG: hypothetical protein ACLGH0_15430, partial [Thermoanaerobaculia bacterium]